MKSIKVFLTPSYNSTREEMGIDEFEDYDSDRVRFQQGSDTEQFEVKPGETFTISGKYEGGYVQCNGKKLKLKFNDEFDEDEEYDEDDEQIELSCGKYKFHKDGVTIECIEDDDIFDDDYSEDFKEDFDGNLDYDFDDNFDDNLSFNFDDDDDY